MAGYLFQFTPLFKKSLGNIFNQSIGSVRNASKKKKSATSRPRKAAHAGPNPHGVKVKEFESVRSGQLLCHQRSLRLCPGLNVGLAKIAGLYAKVDGKVVVSCEKTNFDEQFHIVNISFPTVKPIYHVYLNVIPEPQHQRFKLVEKF